MNDPAISMAAFAAVAVALAMPSPGPVRRRLASVVGRETRPAASVGPFRRAPVTAVLAGSAATVLLLGVRTTIGVLAAGLVVGVMAHRAQTRRREQALRMAVVEFLRGIAAELRSGRTSGMAFRAAAEATPEPLRTVLAPAADVALRGDATDLGDAVAYATATAATPNLDGLNRLVACWRVAAASGATLAPAVDRVADAVRDEMDLDRALVAALAGARASVRLLATLPAVGLLMGTAIGADPVGFLLGSPAGLACAVCAVLLDVAGVRWARRIGRRAARIG